MQPTVLKLPNSLRNRLDAAFEELRTSPSYQIPDKLKPPEVSGITLSANEYVLHRVLFDSNACAEDRAFVVHFMNAKGALETGSGAPAIMLDNLPQKHGEAFAQALGQFFGTGKLEMDFDNFPKYTVGQVLHRDGSPDHEHLAYKFIPIIYCNSPGKPNQPTVFATADEIIEYWAKSQSDKTGVSVEDAYRKILDDFKNITFTSKKITTPQPLLEENPNYSPENGAPRYFFSCRLDRLLSPGHEARLHGADGKFYAGLHQALDDMNKDLSKTSVASTKANTLVFYNNALVHHAGGHLQGKGEQRGRKVIAIDSYAATQDNNAASLPDVSTLTDIPARPAPVIALPPAYHSPYVRQAVAPPVTHVKWNDLDGPNPTITGYYR